LFKTRGVPGTHDTNLIKKFFDFIKKKKFRKFDAPRFDKSIDDRLKKKYWFNIKEKPEVVLLEGWCVGAKPQINLLLKKPINNLEKYEDKDLTWRRYVNQKLKTEYKKLFAMIDYFIFMKIPNFNKVFKWRLIQERKLRKRSHKTKKIMLYNEIKRFIMFYERITLQMLKVMPKIASIVLSLNNEHQINKIRFKN
jgi:D-glycerate 3-kinase